MLRRDADRDRDFADRQVTDAMNDRQPYVAETLARFVRNSLELGQRHRIVGLVCEPADGAAVVRAIANDAQERYDAAAAGLGRGRFDGTRVDRRPLDAVRG